MPALSPANRCAFICNCSALCFGGTVTLPLLETTFHIRAAKGKYLPSPPAARIHISCLVVFLMFHRTSCKWTNDPCALILLLLFVSGIRLFLKLKLRRPWGNQLSLGSEIQLLLNSVFSQLLTFLPLRYTCHWRIPLEGALESSDRIELTDLHGLNMATLEEVTCRWSVR